MLLTVALVLLVSWLAGVLFADAGDTVHLLLLVGLLLLLITFLRAREAAMRRALDGHGGPRP
jgi:hypothetical protein